MGEACEGDLWICGDCGCLMTLRKGAWALMTESEMHSLGPDRQKVEATQEAVRQWRRRSAQ